MLRIIAAYFLLSLFIGNGLAQESDESDNQLSISLDVSPVFINVGEKKVILCNGTAPHKNWVDTKNVVVGPRDYKRRFHVERLRDQIALVFDEVKLGDNGTWTCRAGNINRTIDIYIVEEVTFEESKGTEYPKDGSALELSCKARGTPKPELIWYRDNAPIAIDSEKYKVFPDGRLRITRVNRSDSGEYECKAHQIVAKLYFHVNSTKTLVRVQHAPIIEHDVVQDLYAIVNETKVLRCAATAFPKPNYRWISSDKRSWDEEMNKLVFTANDSTYSELTLEIKSVDDLAITYTCIVTNTQGMNKTTYHLLQGNKPQPLQLVTFKSADNQSMTFEVACGNCTNPIESADQSPNSENLPVTHYRFELVNSSDANVNWDELGDQVVVVEVPRVENDTEYMVDGLQPMTTYQIRVAAVNLAGLSDFISITAQSTTSLGVIVTPRVASMLVLLLVALSRQNVWWY